MEELCSGGPSWIKYEAALELNGGEADQCDLPNANHADWLFSQPALPSWL